MSQDHQGFPLKIAQQTTHKRLQYFIKSVYILYYTKSIQFLASKCTHNCACGFDQEFTSTTRYKAHDLLYQNTKLTVHLNGFHLIYKEIIILLFIIIVTYTIHFHKVRHNFLIIKCNVKFNILTSMSQNKETMLLSIP